MLIRSLCFLCVLRDSVVSGFSRQFTTETQRAQRAHREFFIFRQTPSRDYPKLVHQLVQSFGRFVAEFVLLSLTIASLFVSYAVAKRASLFYAT
jgi:hypothetical protein